MPILKSLSASEWIVIGTFVLVAIIVLDDLAYYTFHRASHTNPRYLDRIRLAVMQLDPAGI